MKKIDEKKAKSGRKSKSSNDFRNICIMKILLMNYVKKVKYESMSDKADSRWELGL